MGGDKVQVCGCSSEAVLIYCGRVESKLRHQEGIRCSSERSDRRPFPKYFPTSRGRTALQPDLTPAQLEQSESTQIRL